MLTGGEGGGGGGGGGRGKGPAGAALRSAVAAPAVWRRTGAAGAPPAGARSSPGRASSRGSFGRARCARGLGRPRVAAAPELVRRGLAGRAARARPASPAPAPASPPGGGASAAAGYTERAGARAEPSPSRCRRRRAPLPGSLPARRPGCGGRRAGGTRAGERRALGLAPKTGPSDARGKCGRLGVRLGVRGAVLDAHQPCPLTSPEPPPRAPLLLPPAASSCCSLFGWAFFWGGGERVIVVCASRGGSQVRGPYAPLQTQPAWGVSLPTRGMWASFFFLSRQCSVETISPRGPPSLTACSVHLLPPHPRPSQHPSKSAAPQLRNTWWKEKKGGPLADPHP